MRVILVAARKDKAVSRREDGVDWRRCADLQKESHEIKDVIFYERRDSGCSFNLRPGVKY